MQGFIYDVICAAKTTTTTTTKTEEKMKPYIAVVITRQNRVWS